MTMPEPEPKFAVGDWVTDGVVIGYVSSILSQHTLIVTATDGKLYSMTTSILIRFDPFEVVVHIGCLSGTVEKAQDYAYFLLWHSKTDCDYSMIKWSAIDTPTREMVERLLKAQDSAVAHDKLCHEPEVKTAGVGLIQKMLMTLEGDR
jgi:hypothetical protein